MKRIQQAWPAAAVFSIFLFSSAPLLAQCTCTVPNNSLGLPAGSYKVVMDPSIPSGSTLAQAVNNSLGSWQAIEQTSSGTMPQLSTTSSSQNALTFEIDSRQNWTAQGATSSDNYFYFRKQNSDGSWTATIIFFS